MKTITASPGIVLPLGREGENNARQILFDITDWQSEFGADGTVALLAQLPNASEPYPVSVSVSGSTVTWTITSADTSVPGIFGRAELQYRIGDVVVKSSVWQTFIADALGTPSPTPPEPQQAWVDQVLDAAQNVETAVVNGPKIQDGNWWVWDFSQGAYVDTGVAASSSYTLPTATSDTLGGVKADPAQSTDTQPVRIGTDNKLYTEPGSAQTPVIDLLSQGVTLNFGENFVTIPDEIGEQIKSASLDEGAIVKAGINIRGDVVPVQGYFFGASIALLNVYQLSGKFYLQTGISVYLLLQNSTTALSAYVLQEQNPLPDVTAANNGQFLRVVNGEWAADAVPSAEGVGF